MCSSIPKEDTVLAMNVFDTWMVWAALWAMLMVGVLIMVGVYEYLDGALDEGDIMEYTKEEMYADLAYTMSLMDGQ
jgi:hypothetical protein